MRRTLVIVACAAAALFLAPAGPAAPDDGLPDVWTGSWPSQLMPGAEALGTLTWRPIRYDDGVALLGKNYGGKIFEGCPADGRTRFFRGRYDQGGTLIACTAGQDAKTLLGRFDGNEQLRSGTFEVKLIREEGQPLFFGQYFEDNGITTDWCGVLDPASRKLVDVDTAAPLLDLGRATRTGRVATVRLRAYDRSATVRVQVQLRRAGRIVAQTTTTVRGDGTLKLARLRVPGSLRGTLSAWVRARDASGNATPWTPARLRA